MVDKNTLSMEFLAYRLESYDALAHKLSLLLEELYEPGTGAKKDAQVCKKCEKRRRLDSHDPDCFIGKLDHIVWWGVPK